MQFFICGNLDFQHVRDRQTDHPEIEYDIQGGGSDDQRIRLNALPCMLAVPAIPVETDRRALEGKREEEGEEVAKGHRGRYFDHPTRPRGWENAHVKQEEADLGQ